MAEQNKEIYEQLSFIEVSNVSKKKAEPSLITFIRRRIDAFKDKSCELKKENKNLKKDYEIFIQDFLKMWDALSIEEDLFIQENFATDYHNLCKLFMDYLNTFVYADGLTTALENNSIVRIEKLVLNDTVTYRDPLYVSIIKNVKNRSKLRVNNYLVINGKNLLEKLNYLFYEENFNKNELYDYIVGFNDYVSFEDIFEKFDPRFIEENNREILAMLLLWYLEKCVYNDIDASRKLNDKSIQQMEIFIVYYMSDNFELTEKQKRTYKQVQISISKKFSSFINKEAVCLESDIRDFDSLKGLSEQEKYKLIDGTENLNNFPSVIDREELKTRLRNFLNHAFLLGTKNRKENLPIFLEELTTERHKALTLALEYIKRFVYKGNEEITDPVIWTLEDYIYHEENLKLTDSTLCVTKSDLLARTSLRYVKASAETKRLEEHAKRQRLLQSN